MASTKPVIQFIDHYQALWSDRPEVSGVSFFDSSVVQTVRSFVQSHTDCCERTCEIGHITGSAFVTTEDMSHVLLTLHRKLGKWLQLGGHADGDENIARVAHREACEESGLECMEHLPYEQLLNPAIGEHPVPFDLDVHSIPMRAGSKDRPGEPAHFHYDVRFLLITKRNQMLKVSHESKDLRWVPLDEVYRLSSEPSVLRQVAKLKWIKSLRGRE